jgi:hypothetical protein
MDKLRRLCSIAGPTILLAAWLTQQFVFDRWNGQLTQLGSAEAVWEGYRSNNYLFNALRRDKPSPSSEEKVDNVERWQKRNLEVGAQRLERLIDPKVLSQTKQDIMEAEDGGSGTLDGYMDIKFKTLFAALDLERQQLLQKKQQAGYAFWCLYLLGAATTILGTILKELIEHRKTMISAASAS